jgi:cell division protein ZapA (FtsZ GTPase activity inhibitor)
MSPESKSIEISVLGKTFTVATDNPIETKIISQQLHDYLTKLIFQNEGVEDKKVMILAMLMMQKKINTLEQQNPTNLIDRSELEQTIDKLLNEFDDLKS